MSQRKECVVRILLGLVLFWGVWILADGRVAAGGPVEVDGIIEPYLVVEVGSEVAGVLDRLEVDRGDTLKAGQVVATLRSGVEKANLELVRTRARMEAQIELKRVALEFARRNSQRIKELYDAKALAFQKWDEVETQQILAERELKAALEQQELAELEHRQAEAVLQRKTIHSPVTGVVMERHLSKGEYVEDKPIVKIAKIDPLNVEVVMPVAQIGLVKVGTKARVIPERPVGDEYQATVTVVDKVVDAASGTFGVRLEIPNPAHQITPGLKCRVIFPDP